MLRDECRHFDRALQRRGCRSKRQFSTSVCTFMQFSKCRSKLDVVSAIGFVQDYNTFIYERLFSTLVANVALVALSQTYFGWWASLSAQFWRSGIHLFWVQPPSELWVEERNLLSGATKFPSCWCCCISVHVPTSFLLLWTTTSLHSKEVEHRSRKVQRFRADKRIHVW